VATACALQCPIALPNEGYPHVHSVDEDKTVLTWHQPTSVSIAPSTQAIWDQYETPELDRKLARVYEGAGFDREHNIKYRLYYKVVVPTDMLGQMGLAATYPEADAVNPSYYYDETSGEVLDWHEGLLDASKKDEEGNLRPSTVETPAGAENPNAQNGWRFLAELDFKTLRYEHHDVKEILRLADAPIGSYLMYAMSVKNSLPCEGPRNNPVKPAIPAIQYQAQYAWHRVSVVDNMVKAAFVGNEYCFG
jgi:hypothetical protein